MTTRLKFSGGALLAFTIVSVSFGSAVPRVVKDIYPGAVADGSGPREFTQLGDKVIFSALQTHSIGRELWITDGTESGTQLVRDVRLGWSWGEPEGMTELNGIALFAGDNGIVGNELWITDGTPAGTRLLKDLDVGTLDGDPEYLVRYKGRIYFSAESDEHGQEVFVSDGTVEGTTVFVDLVPGPGDSDPERLVVANGLLYFVADTPESGEELWVSDGTAEGTRLLKDIRPGESDADIDYPIAVPNGLFFVADDGSMGDELWFTDGSEAGTQQVKDIRPGSSSSSPRELVDANGVLFFRATTAETGYELWKSDGTSGGTVLVKDIRAGSGGSTPTEFVALGSRVIFAANTDAESKEPWVSDGTEGGTLMLKDILEGSDSSFPNSFTRIGDAVFFGIQMDANDYELWKTDGTPDGTVRVKDVRISDPGFNFDGKLLFAGSDTEAITATELWISDGTPSGTKLIRNIAPDLGSSSPDHLTAVGDSVYFGALEGVEGSKRERIYSLWKSGGFHSKSERMTRLTSERFPGDLFEIANLNDTYAIFSGRIETETGFELGISNGTPESTGILKDLRPGPGSSTPSYFAEYNNHVYFSNNFRLWRTDGTEAGTLELEPTIFPFPTVALGDLYFQGRGQGESGGQLWRAGTGLDTAEEVAVVNPGSFAQINFITEFQGVLYFSATDQGVNNVESELWTSDGISSASEVKDIWPGLEGSNPVNLVVAGDFLYFSADDGSLGYELWKSDGTESGTVLLKDIRPGPESSNIRSSSLIEFTGEIYFVADDGISGVELWKSDGTAAGTRLLKDIYPGPHSSMVPYEWQPVEFEGLLYFTASCPNYGYELWQTDGTPEGTRLAFDIFPGPESSVPEQLTVADGRLYFTAFSQRFGNELHVYDPKFVDVPIELSLEDNQVVLQWSPTPERILQLEESSSAGAWMPVSTPPTVSGSTHSVSLPAVDSPRFFRLVEP